MSVSRGNVSLFHMVANSSRDGGGGGGVCRGCGCVCGGGCCGCVCECVLAEGDVCVWGV